MPLAQNPSLNYSYPEELIALKPSTHFRALFVGDNKTEILENKMSLFDKFSEGDILAFNQTQVLCRKLRSLEGIDVVFVRKIKDKMWEVLYPSKKTKSLTFKTDKLIEAHLVKPGLPQLLELSHDINESDFEIYGLMALPPYIMKQREKRDFVLQNNEDNSWYQTDWALKNQGKGSLASPTASLHFDSQDLKFLEKQKKVRLAPLILHVGIGTFLPIRGDLNEHKMHEEEFVIPQKTREILSSHARNQLQKNHNKLWALGTTTVRALESYAREACFSAEPEKDYRTSTSLFLKPGSEFLLVDALMTNFHQPQSSLLALVQAFAGESTVQQAYQKAISHKFHLFSYGDLSVWIK